MAKKVTPADIQDEVATTSTISAKELASRLGTDPKSFRRWLRRQLDSRAGKGGRWAFTEEMAAELMLAYNTKAEADYDDADDADDALMELEDIDD